MTKIPGLHKVTLDIRLDSRGWFEETWQLEKWANGPIHWFRPVQQNASVNTQVGTTRGLHAEPWNKFVTVLSGQTFCAWVDLRAGKSFGLVHWDVVSPGQAFFVPKGVANGYQALEDNTVYSYLVDSHWFSDSNYLSVDLFDDKLSIPWPISKDNAIISNKDRGNPSFSSISPIEQSKVLLFGASGQIGTEINKIIPDTVSMQRTSPILEGDFYNDVRAIINAAAFTDVDKAEKEEFWPLVRAGNQLLVDRLALSSKRADATLVHFSSDYVFDGLKSTPWTEEDLPNPLSKYGMSKLLGDFAALANPHHYIIRTSWVYGNGRNFIRTMQDRALGDIPSSVVDDQFGRPTWAKDVADFTQHLLDSKAPFGTYHFSNSGDSVSWYELAIFVYEYFGKPNSMVTRISTAEHRNANRESAKRPRNSTLGLHKAESLGYKIPDWREALSSYLDGHQ